MKIAQMLLCLFFISLSYGQTSKTKDTAVPEDTNAFNDYYPIAEKPTFSYMSNMTSRESILFDAKPVVYYSILNNIRKNMRAYDDKAGNAFYVTFQPHIRMYGENSKPVKTPSYRILFGWQHMIKTKHNNFFTWAIETGHYSNGQSGCAFLSGEEDETMPCTEFHETITNNSNLSELLNRKNGNFSTNTTKVSFNFRFNEFNANDEPYKVHSFTTSWELYHNLFLGLLDFGGYSEFDINIYGRNRFGFGYEYEHQWKPKLRYAIEQKIELIQGAHPFVEPLRSETTLTLYPFNRDIGLFVSYIYGHDNYNYRFVDSGNQIAVGVSWDWFKPFQISRVQTK